MSKLTVKPNDYTTQFNSDYGKIDAAVACAEGQPAIKVAEQLMESANNIKGKSKSISGDDGVQKLSEAMNDTASNLLICSEASNNYGTQVEPCYTNLKAQLEALKDTEESYKKLCANGPDKDDFKKTKTDSNGNEKTTYPGYDNAEELWKEKIKKAEKTLQSMVDNVNNIKNQLKAAGEADVAEIAASGFNISMPDIIPFVDDSIIYTDFGNEDFIQYDNNNNPYVEIDGKKYPIDEFIEEDGTKQICGYIITGNDGRKYTIFNQDELGWPGDCNRAGMCSAVSGYTDDTKALIEKAKKWNHGLGYNEEENNKFLEEYGLTSKVIGGKNDVRKFETSLDTIYDNLSKGNKVMIHILPTADSSKNPNGAKGAFGASGQKWASSMHWVDLLRTKKVGNETYVFVSDSGHGGTTNDSGTGFGKGWYNTKEFNGLDINYVTIISPTDKVKV